MVATRSKAKYSAARGVAGIAELLMMVGELLVGDQPLLAKLCLVSRAFNAVFSPFLYRIVLLEEKGSRFPTDGDLSAGLAVLEQFINTRILRVQFSSKQWKLSAGTPVFHDFVSSILQRMKNVELIRLHGVTIAHSCINHLGSNLNLKHLHVDFNTSLLRRRSRYPQFMPNKLKALDPESPFKTLRRLSFEDLDSSQEHVLSGYIASVLIQTPNLEHLRLSVSSSQCTDFLRLICNDYANLGGGNPLRLKSLILGKFIHMIPEELFSRLVDVSDLERVQVGADCSCDHGRVLVESLTTFTPSKTPEMQQLEILELKRNHWTQVERALAGTKALKVGKFQWEAGGPVLSLNNLAGWTKVQKLQVPLCMSSIRNVPWFFKDTDRCDLLTHLTLNAAADVCRPESNGAWRCCLPDVCEGLPNLPNLTAFHFCPYGGAKWSNCHGKKDLQNAAVVLMEACTKLEYVELYGVAYGADWREAADESPEKTWTHLSEAEKQVRRPDFFVED